jgi:predicted  nucleic acid-binding Zn-ribbon protein
MEFPELLEHLKALRTLTTDEEDARSILARLPDDRRAAEEKLAAAHRAAAAAAQEGKLAAAESKTIDAALRDLDARRRKYQGQLPQARTMETMTALQHEIETCSRRQAELEDAGLEWILKEEEARRRAEVAREKIERQQTATADAIARIAHREAEAHERLRMAEEERATRLASLDPEDRTLWETLVRRHGGASVVVPLVDGARCGGCDMGVVLNTREGVASGRRVVRCEHCGRVLYDPERFA